MKKSWQLVLFGLLFGLLATGIILLVSGLSRGSPVELPPLPTQAPIAVDVAGAVANPGVYFLEADNRVEDAIAAAGGFLPDAFTESINLSAPLTDGSKVLVPKVPESSSADEDGSNNPDTPPASIVFPININTADKDTLMMLPGIGEVKAQAIIDHRNEHGPFTEIEQIQEVIGIGPVTLDNIRALITIY